MKENSVNEEKLKEFLKKAKQDTYANKNKEPERGKYGENIYIFSEGDLSYEDTYFGGGKFEGWEVVKERGKPIWHMIYYGGVTQNSPDKDDVYIRLKEFLSFPDSIPARGVDSQTTKRKDGTWIYHNRLKGTENNIFDFEGHEFISLDGSTVYELSYKGGKHEENEEILSEERLNAFLKNYEAASNTHDFQKVEPFIHKKAVYEFTDGSHKGIGKIKEAFEKTFNKIKNETYTISNIAWLFKTHKYVTCRYDFHWKGIVEGKETEGMGKGTAFIIKTEEGLQILYERLSNHT